VIAELAEAEGKDKVLRRVRRYPVAPVRKAVIDAITL